MQKIILFPFNGNAREAVSVIEAINGVQPTWKILGFLDDDPQKWGNTCGKYSVLGGRQKITEYKHCKFLAVPGRPENFTTRKTIIDLLQLSPHSFATIISPFAHIGTNVIIGYNTLIMAGVVLTVDISIGSHVVILPNTVVSHDSIVEDYTMIGSNVSISGGVSIKKNAYIGSGVKIIQEITVHSCSLIGLGSVVTKNVSENMIVVGNPARELKKSL